MNLVAPNREENGSLRDSHSGAHKGFDVSLVAVLAEAGHFASRRHFDTQHDVRTCSKFPEYH